MTNTNFSSDARRPRIDSRVFDCSLVNVSRCQRQHGLENRSSWMLDLRFSTVCMPRYLYYFVSDPVIQAESRIGRVQTRTMERIKYELRDLARLKPGTSRTSSTIYLADHVYYRALPQKIHPGDRNVDADAVFVDYYEIGALD